MWMELIREALQKIEQGHIDDGLEKLAKLEETNDHELKYTIAELYHELGHVERAKRLIDELLLFYPDEGDLRVFAAELLIDLDEEDEAIEQLMVIKEEDESFVRAQLLLADLYQMQSLDEVAEQKLLSAEKKAPNEPVISYGLGLFYLEQGDYLKSIPYLKKAVHAEEPISDEQLELYLAEAYSASGQFEDAAHYYRKGLKQYVDSNALFGYGFTAYQLGDMVVAINQLEKLKESDPDFSSVYPLLAKAYEAEERLEEAMAVLKEGLAIDEYNEQLYVHAGKLSMKRQKPAEGEHYLRQVIALNPGNIEGVQTLASYFKHEERYDELLELIEHVKEFGEEDHLLTWYEASALKEQEEYDQAYERYQGVEQFFAEDVDFLEEYGYFLLEFGLRAHAKKQFQTILTLQPERTDVEQLLYDLDE